MRNGQNPSATNRPRRKARPARPRGSGPGALNARNADPLLLYQASVQNPEAELGFVDRVYRARFGRLPRTLREDFCGTSLNSCEWVKRRPGNRAVGIDLDTSVLAWARRENVSRLTDEQAARVELRRENVMDAGRLEDGKRGGRKGLGGGEGFEVVLAVNFSYWVFRTRETMGRYFRAVRASLEGSGVRGKGGVFVLDFFGGSDVLREMKERRRCWLRRDPAHPERPSGAFTYIWDQARYDPVSGRYTCRIHFEFGDGSTIERAFTYDWRAWTMAEVRELLGEAGFARSEVYLEGETARGEGDGVFRRRESGPADRTFLAYIVASG